MKKTYVKPLASFESFELSASIAGGCAKPMGHTQTDCSYYVGGVGNIFVNDVQVCVYVQPDGAYGVCYHVPTDAQKLFTS